MWRDDSLLDTTWEVVVAVVVGIAVTSGALL